MREQPIRAGADPEHHSPEPAELRPAPAGDHGRRRRARPRHHRRRLRLSQPPGLRDALCRAGALRREPDRPGARRGRHRLRRRLRRHHGAGAGRQHRRRRACCSPRRACRPAPMPATSCSTMSARSASPPSCSRSPACARWKARSPAPSSRSSGIKAARVHIVMSERANFRRDEQKPSASVVIRASGIDARARAPCRSAIWSPPPFPASTPRR